MGDIELTSAELDELDGYASSRRLPTMTIETEAILRLISLARAGLEARKAEESMRPMGWFVRYDQGCEWQYISGDPERSMTVRDWERKRAFIDEPALPLTGDKP